MKFKAEPNLYVRVSNKIVQRTTGLKGFNFDENGEYETENPMMINVLSQNFEVIEEVLEQAEEVVEVEEIKETVEVIEVKLFKCKKCDFKTDNKGELLAHYKKDHPKEG